MSAARPLRARAARSDGELLARLERIEAKLDALLASRPPEQAPGLVDALREHFGSGVFTVRGLLTLCDEEPHCALADELAAVIDWEATPHVRAVALGMLLTRLPGIEIKRSRVRMYRFRPLRDPTP